MFSIDELNSQQRAAVQAPEGPTMVMGGPGSGKTRVLAYRIAHLLQLGVPASQILILSFTNKAVNEMKCRVFSLVGERSRNIGMGTYQTVFARILRRHAEVVGYGSNFSIYDTIDSANLVKSVMKSLGISIQRFAPQEILSCISSAKSQLMTAEGLSQHASDLFTQLTVRVFNEYQKRLKQYNAMDLDDLVLKPIEIFSKVKKILAWYQDRIRFLLIDDFHDINRAQYLLSRFLVGKYRNIFVVGDESQYTNAYRSANILNRIEFYSDFSEANIIRFEQNYRSTRTILEATDQVIKNNVSRVSKKHWTENQQGELITVLKCEDDRDEASTIVRYISKECCRLKIDLKDFAIVYRTNAQSRALEDALHQSKLPYVLVGGIGFYQKNEIKDVLAYFRILTNESDDESILRILRNPIHGIGEVALNGIKQFAFSNRLTLFQAVSRVEEIIKLQPTVKENLFKLFTFHQKYKRLMKRISLSELSRTVVDELGILRILKEEGTSESLICRENIQKLLSDISEFSELQPDATLENFLEDVSLMTHADRHEYNQNAVTLTTLHSSKGLEFPVVFIVGVEEGLLPFYSNEIGIKNLEEERHLFYIGMSRAMKKLYITCVEHRHHLGQIRCQSTSRFLHEINPNLLEIIDLVRKKDRFSENQTRIRRLERRNLHDVLSQPAFNSTDTEMPNVNSDYLNCPVKIGGHVEHSSFGRGKVLSVSGKGDSMKVAVDFRNNGKKDLLLKYAHLRVI